MFYINIYMHIYTKNQDIYLLKSYISVSSKGLDETEGWRFGRNRNITF